MSLSIGFSQRSRSSTAARSVPAALSQLAGSQFATLERAGTANDIHILFPVCCGSLSGVLRARLLSLRGLLKRGQISRRLLGRC